MRKNLISQPIFIFCLAVILQTAMVACNNKKDEDKVPVKEEVKTNFNSLIEDRIGVTIKKIDSFAATRDIYAARNLKRKTTEIIQETDETCDYFERWEIRLMLASGGRNKDGTPKNPDDTVVATKLLVHASGGDSVKKFITEMKEILIAQVKDSATLRNALTLEFEDEHAGAAKGDWNATHFKGISVADAIVLFEKFRYEVRSSELVVLNRILKDAQKRK